MVLALLVIVIIVGLILILVISVRVPLIFKKIEEKGPIIPALVRMDSLILIQK